MYVTWSPTCLSWKVSNEAICTSQGLNDCIFILQNCNSNNMPPKSKRSGAPKTPKTPRTYTYEVRDDARVDLPRVSVADMGAGAPPSTSSPSSSTFSTSSSPSSLPAVDLPYVSV